LRFEFELTRIAAAIFFHDNASPGQMQILGKVHRAHPTRAEQLEDAIAIL
jgi:hypothetical protein